MHAWLHQLDQHFPVRYTAWLLSAVGLLLFGFTFVLFHHMIGGIRHLVWDRAIGLDAAGRETIVRVALGCSIALTLIVWAVFVWFK